MQEAARHLIKLQVFFDGKDAYSFNYEGKVHVFRGTVEELAKFLQSFKAKDNNTQPRSARGERYIDIANEIMNQTDNVIYAWSNDLSNALLKRESAKTEAVEFAKDGPIVRNTDGKLLDNLFEMLDGDPRWKIDKNRLTCVRNDGWYFTVKGNVIEFGKGSTVYLVLPWTRKIEFQILPSGFITVMFDVNGAGPGRFML